MRNALLIVAGLALPYAAQAKAAEDSKIGYVDMNRVLNEVEDGKSAKAKLKSQFEDRQKKLDEMQTELKTKKEDFDKRASTMKPEARDEKQAELQRKVVELQQTYMKLQQELMDEESKVTQSISRKARALVDKIGDRDGYTVILDIGDTVLYFKRHMDLTEEIIREYNKQYGKK